jgi:SAM-dependent methyltransferase
MKRKASPGSVGAARGPDAGDSPPGHTRGPDTGGPPPADDPVLREQIDYYRARADEYDQWYFRQGRYDRGPELNAQWFAEARETREALERFAPRGRILELAGGTGLWTRYLVPRAEHLTVVDASAEVLKLNRGRVGADRVTHVQADVFSWRADQQYDVVFFAFWLSHVPPHCFGGFWESVRNALAPDGRVLFVDSRYDPTSTALDHRLNGRETETVTRRLNDGRTYRIVKVFYEPEDLSRRLADLGWHARVHATEHYFLWGQATRA